MATVHTDLRWPDGRCVVTGAICGSWFWRLDDSPPDQFEYGFPTESDALTDARAALADHIADTAPPECVFCDRPVQPDWSCDCEAAVIHRLRSAQAEQYGDE